MNEPHDVPDIAAWVDSVQFVVNAVRNAGSKNFLLLPGSSWSSAQAFPTEAGPLLVKVTDPLGDTSKLIFDGMDQSTALGKYADRRRSTQIS